MQPVRFQLERARDRLRGRGDKHVAMEIDREFPAERAGNDPARFWRRPGVGSGSESDTVK